uniref:proline-rich protein 12-like n=1 Tax=Scatophagus argus TaxID=75038 RepID=UPI001ED85DEB|nr:proline-rich protein 12-like [Scatophagus argus]
MTACLMYGSSRSSHSDSELHPRPAYGTSHPLQGYATNHDPGSSRQCGTWVSTRRMLGLTGPFDASLHHASSLDPDPSAMSLISALESRGSQPPPSTFSIFSQFRSPSWQAAMHTPSPAELFISGALPGSSSFTSSSTLSAYQHPGSFSGRSFISSLSLEDTSTFSQTSSSLLSPHDPRLHIKAPSQSSFTLDRLLPSQNSTYWSSQDPTAPPQTQDSSSCHVSPRQLNLLSSQLHKQSTQLCNRSMFASSSDTKSSPRMELKTYQPVIKTPYTFSSSSSSSSSSSRSKGAKSSSSRSGYSSTGSASSSSHTPHTPPSASSASSLPSSSSKTSTDSFSAPSHQQAPSQSAPAPPPPSVVSSTFVQQQAPRQCLSKYDCPTPPQQHAQSCSPNHLAQSYGPFNSSHAQDPSSGAGGTGAKAFIGIGIGSGGHSFSSEIFGDSSFGSASLRKEDSSPLGYGGLGASEGNEPISGAAARGSARSGSGASSVGNGGSNSYHLPESSPSPSNGSIIICPGLHSPASANPWQSSGGSGATKYLSSILSSTLMSLPQGFPEHAQNQSYQSTPSKPKIEILGLERSQDEDEDEDDFLFHHLLHTQSSAPHPSQHHPPPQQPPQPLPQARDGEDKGVTYEINNLQSVIRTNSTTSSSAPGLAIGDAASSLNSQLEMSQEKQQQTKLELTVSKSTAGGLGRVTDSFSHSHTTHSHQQQHISLDRVVCYERGDLYTQQSHAQHSNHTSPVSLQHSQHTQCTQRIQHCHHSRSSSHSHSHPHMELKKPSDVNGSIYSCNTPEVQQARQNQASLSLMVSPPGPPQQAHTLQSILSCTTYSKMDSQQAPSQQQQHPLSQQAMMGAARPAEVESHPQNQSSQLSVQLQTQGVDTHHCTLGGQSRDQTQANQNSVSLLNMLEQSLSHTNSKDIQGTLDRTGVGEPVTGRKGSDGDRHRQQHGLTPHHDPRQPGSDLLDFFSEAGSGLSTHAHTYAHHQQQAHTHHRLSHSQASNRGTPQQQPQKRKSKIQLSHSQLDQLKQHQFVTASPFSKVGQNQAQQTQQCAPLSSICFPDTLLHDEDRSFFPEMEDMFYSADYKSSCAGDSGAGRAAQESITQGHGQRHKVMEALKTGDPGEGYDLVGHYSNQVYGQYCHSLPGTGNGNLHLDLDSMKTHMLPSTVNTDQIGFFQSQTPTVGLSSAVQGDGSVNKIVGAVGVGGSASTTGLTSHIFCSSPPKKLLKTSSFYLLKQRREPQPQTKNNYVQEYEFEDDEDKADVPADIRLNSRRLPDLIPDLGSTCRKSGGTSGVRGLSPLMGDMDFCHPSRYSSLGHPPQPPHHDGPKKRGRKPTKSKCEGPPRPRGRPHIRPLPEPPYCRGLMVSVAGESRRGRGRGRGRGRREEGLMEVHQDMTKAQSLQHHNQQQSQQQQFSQQHPH